MQVVVGPRAVLVPLRFAGSTEPVEAVIDTGFTGSLLLPGNVAREVGGTLVAVGAPCIIQDGREFACERWFLDLVWFDEPRPVLALVSEASSEVLVGLELLRDTVLQLCDAGAELRRCPS